jgi:Zn ribbon nucleic-acid-binding protein
MDFIFEEDMDDVGSDIEAYCPKCKADTAHTVITKYEDEVRRVQCSTCGDVHAYRKPRGEVEEEIPEPIAAKKRAQAKKPTWQEAVQKVGQKGINHARPYTIRDHYHEGDIVSHPKFGVGFVTEISENKAEVTFQDERRVLVHNRPDLAAQMPAIAPTPAPREEKKGKKGAKGKAAAAEAAAKGGGKAAPPVKPIAAASPIKPVPAAKGGPAAPPAKVPPLAGKAAEASKKPIAATSTPPAPPVSGKQAARAKAAVTKKGAAKGKVVPQAKPAAPAAKSARPAAAAARVRPTRPVAKAPPAKLKSKANKVKKAGKR